MERHKITKRKDRATARWDSFFILWIGPIRLTHTLSATVNKKERDKSQGRRMPVIKCVHLGCLSLSLSPRCGSLTGQSLHGFFWGFLVSSSYRLLTLGFLSCPYLSSPREGDRRRNPKKPSRAPVPISVPRRTRDQGP